MTCVMVIVDAKEILYPVRNSNGVLLATDTTLNVQSD